MLGAAIRGDHAGMSDVFISYARTTGQKARLMSDALTAIGYSVWSDEQLPAHRNYSHVIEEQLGQAKAVLVLWSAEAAGSDWVMDEAERAREQRKLVQVSLDGTRLPMPFGRIQCADLAGWSGDTRDPGWRKAVESIGVLVAAAREARSRASRTSDTILQIEPGGLVTAGITRVDAMGGDGRDSADDNEPFFEAYATHTGAARKANEDAFLARSEAGLWALAGGMGGFQNGSWASRTVIEGLAGARFSGDIATDAAVAVAAIRHANSQIFKESTERYKRMGSTAVALIVAGGRFAAIWAGDSRAYLWRRGTLRALTRDHTQVRQMVEAGYLSPEAAREHPMAHVLARAVGVQAELELERAFGEVEAGDLFLLCSDGLHAVLTDDDIAGGLRTAAPSAAAEGLLELALRRGASDDVTVLAIGRGDLREDGRRGRKTPVLGGAAAETAEAVAMRKTRFAPAAAGPGAGAVRWPLD
jgi:serine/threonine protein phosphatase PrpC